MTRTVFYSILIALPLILGCSSRPKVREDARYEPYENILEIVSDVQRHANDNTYRFPPPHDPSGQNLYKASLVRLLNFEKIYPRRMPDVVNFTKGICMERLGDYEGALRAFKMVAESDSPLKEQADKKLALLEKFNDLAHYRIEKNNIGDYLTESEFKLAEWGKLVEQAKGTPYEWIALEEEEKAECRLAEFVAQNYLVLKDGAENALNLYRQLTLKHAQSKNINLHYLNWADFCALLAKRYAEGADPRSLDFDRQTFNKSSDAAIRIYSLVAQKDGASEKVEALGKLQAFNAYVAKIQGESQ
ncbi:MAG: hypothetical protein NTZ78_09780 [Candidatus Aureabacteria bacterium]|nr:hypothetical protein [Candidatus Auribacterota bacterium]